MQNHLAGYGKVFGAGGLESPLTGRRQGRVRQTEIRRVAILNDFGGSDFARFCHIHFYVHGDRPGEVLLVRQFQGRLRLVHRNGRCNVVTMLQPAQKRDSPKRTANYRTRDWFRQDADRGSRVGYRSVNRRSVRYWSRTLVRDRDSRLG